MRAGRLNRRITIQQNSPSQDSNGNLTDSWSTFAKVWASIEPLRGREFLEAQAINPETTVRFRIRYVSGVTEDMRIKDENDELYDITAVLHLDHAKREIEIMANRTSRESA